MAKAKKFDVNKFHDMVGKKIGVSQWITITQDMIDCFGDLTMDSAPFHTDPEWCLEHSPYKTTVAYGFLTASLLTPMLRNTMVVDRKTYAYALNYGFDKLRMISAVPVDSRIRGHFISLDFSERNPGELIQKIGVEVEVEGQKKPALIAEWLFLFVVSQSANNRIAGKGD